MTYYDRSNYGYNMNNMRTGVREIGTRVRNRVSDAATTMGNRYEAYQQEQSEKAGDNPLLHVGLVPATVGLFGGIKLLDMANNRQLRKEDAAMFAEALRNAGVHDPAEISRLTKLRADLAAKGVNSDLHATELAARGQLAEADRGILSAGEAQMKKLQEMKTALGTEAAGAGMKTVSALDVNERRFVEDFMRRTKTPDAGNLNEYMQRMLRDPKITPEQKQMIANVSGKLKADPGSVFRTMEALGAPVGITPAQASDIMARRKAGKAIGPHAAVVEGKVVPRPPVARAAGRTPAASKYMQSPVGAAAARFRASYLGTGPGVSRIVSAPISAPVTQKVVDQVGKLGIETYKPGPLRKLLGWGARLFGKRASITPEFAMQKLADVPLAQPLFGHGWGRMIGDLQRNVGAQSVTGKQDLAADQSREKIFADIEKSTGKPFDMDRDAPEYVKRVGGPITQSVFDHMVRRGGNRGLNVGPNQSAMTAAQEAQAKQQLAGAGSRYTPDDLRWDVGMQVFRTDPGLKNRVGAYYDPKTGKIGELYPHGIADREMQRLRPQAIQGREGTLADLLNRREMWRDTKNVGKRLIQTAALGPYGMVAGTGMALAENTRNAVGYDINSKRQKDNRNIPVASTVADLASFAVPSGVKDPGALVKAAPYLAYGAEVLGNIGERVVGGDDGTINKTGPERAYYAAKPHVLRGFGRGEDNQR